MVRVECVRAPLAAARHPTAALRRSRSLLPAHPAPVSGSPAPRVACSARGFATRARRALRLLAAVAMLAMLAAVAHADVVGVKSAEIRAEEDGYYLNAEFELALNPTLEEALQKGVPLYFLLEVEITRPRWYWFDDRVLSATTQYRVSYNALTRQYRVASGLLTLTFDTLAEVERLLSRVTARQIARPGQLPKGVRLEAAVRLRLDVNQLPKPFQVNALASREWSLSSDWQRWEFTA
jgi:hypothetical protein